ncbi:hypothetical protein [Ralstonia psammae]|nr:hypothetical protein [Ralstonia sp. LMG 19083]
MPCNVAGAFVHQASMPAQVRHLGSGFPDAEFLPKEGQARGAQIDLDPGKLGLRYPMEINLDGDSAQKLGALLPHVTLKQARNFATALASSDPDASGVLRGTARQVLSTLFPGHKDKK